MSDQEQNNDEETGLLTKRDFMVACQALAETHNRYLEAYQAEETMNEYTREEMQHAIENTHLTFLKFQAILAATIPQQPAEDVDVESPTLTMEPKS
mgnify:CR=1 FL=1